MTSSGGGGSGGGILLAAGKVDLQTGYQIYARGAKGNNGTNVYRPAGGYDGEPGTFYDGPMPSILIAPGLVISVY